mmetsp:Transcript_21085/g.52427  ORF Transcript_21085/g.52427 Transcript_21085/m.52427 type:complete len:402 (-) Transcript_21085:144-1349(-)|eukprot:CAMPEP_0197576296 /NCGR_PEP_ID=MMETSP1326-20131121/1367_1 /TAXON_ID=1155430 /ORGANISM="Genus nov. species nov., Strain RCC2288" /LENGTH=401 /DNA_ID=CAMNT_0043139183 /DNA_START=246 /DNA_END=1451 /DNA_ORIENTATION=+
MAALGQYLDAASRAVQTQNGPALAQLITTRSQQALAAVAQALQSNRNLNLGSLCSAKVPAPFDEIFATHCQCLGAIGERRWEEAYTALTNTVQAFVKDFKNQETAWSLAALMELVKACRELADKTDAAAVAAGKKATKLHDSGALLMLVYRNTTNTSVKSKKAASLFLVIMLFKIYFKLNTLHLCKNLIAAVNLPAFPAFDSFPMAQKVTYSYYVGRLAVFDDDYTRAEQNLNYAFEHCSARHPHNKKLVLRYLVPVKLILGKCPTRRLLDKYALDEYKDVVEAVKRGNVRALNDALQHFQVVFIMQGTFLVLEKLRNIVYRTLFMKVAAFSAEHNPSKANQVSLTLFLDALVWCGCDSEIDEVECIVANLIFRRFIKGYISHKSRVVVLAKTGAFPPLNE